MSVGDYVWVNPVKRAGIITHIQPPSVIFPTEVMVIDFMDGTEPIPFFPSMLNILSEMKRLEDEIN